MAARLAGCAYLLEMAGLEAQCVCQGQLRVCRTARPPAVRTGFSALFQRPRRAGPCPRVTPWSRWTRQPPTPERATGTWLSEPGQSHTARAASGRRQTARSQQMGASQLVLSRVLMTTLGHRNPWKYVPGTDSGNVSPPKREFFLQPFRGGQSQTLSRNIPQESKGLDQLPQRLCTCGVCVCGVCLCVRDVRGACVCVTGMHVYDVCV